MVIITIIYFKSCIILYYLGILLVLLLNFMNLFKSYFLILN